MKISVLGSGSRGNSIYIESEKIKLLIDAGFSGKKIESRLNNIGQSLKNINGILITHEHSDHIQGAGIVSRKYDIPIYISSESYELGKNKLGNLAPYNINIIEDEFILGDTLIRPFDVMHDAIRTFGFRIENENNKKIAISTDIGCINNIVREQFKDVDAMIIESNYDYDTLMNCSYPWDLKDRIKGNHGHLSNDECAKFINEMYNDNLKKVYLAHISQDSNAREIIYKIMEEKLYKNIDYELTHQEEGSGLFTI